MKKLSLIVLGLLISFTGIYADKLPPMSEGTANGVIIYSRGDISQKFVLDFQKTKSSWGHFCSCHVGISCTTSSGKTRFIYIEGDENTFLISFNDNKVFESDFNLDKSFYSLDKIQDGNDTCLIVKTLKRIEMKNRDNKKEIIHMEPGSVIVYFFNKDYDSYFKY